MKKIYFQLLILLLVAIIPGILSAQKAEYVNQVLGLNGGKFEGTPPYTDFATIQSYNPVTQNVSVFDTIFTQSVQDVVVNGHFAYAAAQDSVVMYNIDNYQRIAAVADSGLSKLFYYNGKLIISKQYPITRFFVEVLDATDLSLIARVDGISGECAGIAAGGGNIYVAVNGGWLGTSGKLAVIDPDTWTLVNEVDLGPSAIGIYNLYTYGDYIFSVNKTPFGGPPSGSISRYNYVTQIFNTNVIGVVVGDGFGLDKQILYLKLNEGMGSYNLDNQAIADTVIVPDPGSANNITIHAGAIDRVNEYAYLTIGNRSSFSVGIVVTLTGDSVTSFSAGVNAEALAIDYRFPSGIGQPVSSSFRITPNPADDHINIILNGNEIKSLKIYDLTGRTVASMGWEAPNNAIKVDCSSFTPGIYMVVVETATGKLVQKFIRK